MTAFGSQPANDYSHNIIITITVFGSTDFSIAARPQAWNQVNQLPADIRNTAPATYSTFKYHLKTFLFSVTCGLWILSYSFLGFIVYLLNCSGPVFLIVKRCHSGLDAPPVVTGAPPPRLLSMPVIALVEMTPYKFTYHIFKGRGKGGEGRVPLLQLLVPPSCLRLAMRLHLNAHG